MNRKRRIYGDKIEFESLSCAPVNELGVVYLFGMLHKSFDFRIESIQSGYPDCIARRRVGKNRWEEVRIEFEFNSRSFQTHAHDPTGVDLIVCWKHDWKGCPSDIEVIELRTILKDVEKIDSSLQKKSELSSWQRFCQQKRLEGLDFAQIAKLWRKQKQKAPPNPPAP
jgi:hypothetical protein